MKYIKFFALVAMAMVTTLASANVTSSAKIRIQANASLVGANLVIVEDDAVANDFSSSNNAVYLPGVQNNYSVDFYAVGAAHNYAAIEIPSLNGLELVFESNNVETEYTMSFSELAGTPIQLLRESNQELIDMDADYELTMAVNATETFTIVMPQPENVYLRQLNAGQQWGTICLPESIGSVLGAAMYEIAGMEGDILYLDEVAAPAIYTTGKPYIFHADGSQDPVKFYIDPAQPIANAPVEALGLVGTFEELNEIPADMHVITNNVVKPAAEGSHVAANRAYLDLSEVPAPAAPAPGIRRVRMHIADVATALENVAVKADGKRLINGQLIIVRDGKAFNAQGKQL